jgi:hypothetical protein
MLCTRARSSARIERLTDEILRSGFERAQLVVRLRGDDQYRQIAIGFDLLQAFHHLKSVHAGHLKIEQDQAVAVRPVQLADLARIRGGLDGKYSRRRAACPRSGGRWLPYRRPPGFWRSEYRLS